MTYTEAQVRYAFPNTIAEMSQLELLIQKKLSMYGLQEMQEVMQIRVLIIQVQNYYQEWLITFQKYKAILLQ